MYSIFRNLAIIILSAKFFGLVARKCKAPQVVGEILAGLVIGPCVLNLVQTSDSIATFAEIGVVLLMFTTGLGTNLKELIKAGPIATLIAAVGVAVPLVGGTLLYGAFYGFAAVGSPEFYRALFIGTIMTATSVSITVATLQELGHLKSFLGTTIVSAAVIDDVMGIVVLTCVLGASSGTGTGLGKVLFNTLLFFATAVGVGLVVHYAMKWLDQRNPHTQRITIVSLAFCFGMAYVAEAYFGIADITGAYIAGIVLCTMNDAPYVERRVDISNYIIFAPIFFASIGLKTDISGLTPEILLFCVCFVIVALITKIIGCGLAAKVCRFNWGDSLKVGVGMIDSRRGGTDRGAEGSCHRRGRPGLLHRRDPVDRGIQRGHPAGTQGDVHQAPARAASQSGKINDVAAQMICCCAKMMCAAAHEGHYGSIEKHPGKAKASGVFSLSFYFTASCRTPSGRHGRPRRSPGAAGPAPPEPLPL